MPESRLTRRGGFALTYFGCAVVGLIALFITRFFRPDTISAGTADILYKVWPIFAGWLPIMFVVISILIANSHKHLFRILGKTGHVGDIVLHIAMCSVLILSSAVTIFFTELYGVRSGALLDLYVFLLAATIFQFIVVGRAIILLAYYSSKVEKDDPQSK